MHHSGQRLGVATQPNHGSNAKTSGLWLHKPPSMLCKSGVSEATLQHKYIERRREAYAKKERGVGGGGHVMWKTEREKRPLHHFYCSSSVPIHPEWSQCGGRYTAASPPWEVCGTCWPSVEWLATLMLNGSLKTIEMNEARRAKRLYVMRINYRRGRGGVYLLLPVKARW